MRTQPYNCSASHHHGYNRTHKRNQGQLVGSLRKLENQRQHNPPACPFGISISPQPLNFSGKANTAVMALLAVSLIASPTIGLATSRHRRFQSPQTGNNALSPTPVALSRPVASSAIPLAVPAMMLMSAINGNSGMSSIAPTIAAGILASAVPASSDILPLSPLSSLFELFSAGAQTIEEPRYFDVKDNIAAIAAAPGMSVARGLAIANILIEAGFPIEQHKFERRWVFSDTQATPPGFVIAGTNLLVNATDYDPGKPTILITAHYDRTEQGSGALDNASGCVAAIELLKVFRDSPLNNHNLQVAFFDAEETGLHGSTVYVQKCVKAGNCPSLTVNLDMLGNGNVLFAAGQETARLCYPFDTDLPSEKNSDEQQFITFLTDAAGNMTVFNSGAASQSDNLPFQRAGQKAVGLSTFAEGEPELLRDYQQANLAMYAIPYPEIDHNDPRYEAQWSAYDHLVMQASAEAKRLADQIMRFKIIHSNLDNTEAVDARELLSITDIIAEALRRKDHNADGGRGPMA